MKVKDLINLLGKENPDYRVVVDGYESGYDEVREILKVNIEKNPDHSDVEKDGRWWDGEFEFSENQESEIAICLPRLM